jgi:hypothetical protein
MPPTGKATAARARKPSTSTASHKTTGRPQFKEPAALKRFGRSLETADSALMELRRNAGHDLGQGARDLYRDLQRFLAQARRDSRKLSSALRRDFDQASRELERSQRQLAARKRTAPARRTTQQAKARSAR